MSVAAECGLGVWSIQLDVEVSCQVFNPHRGIFWEQSLTAHQLLLQLPNIQLRENDTQPGPQGKR